MQASDSHHDVGRPDDLFAGAAANLFGLADGESIDPGGDVPAPDELFVRTQPSTGGALRSTPGDIRTRRVHPSALEPPFGAERWRPFDRRLALADRSDFERLVRGPHPLPRMLAARAFDLPDDLQAPLAVDQYCEVRMALLHRVWLADGVLEILLEDPHALVRRIATERRDDPEWTPEDGHGPDPCVECGGRIKNRDFRTCSVACSSAQRRRRIDSGLWVDAIAADYRHSTGLRRDWPPLFQWRIAAGPSSGGIPGTGPPMRTTLAPFVRDVTAAAIVDLCGRARAAAVDQTSVISELLERGTTGAGPALLADVAARRGL